MAESPRIGPLPSRTPILFATLRLTAPLARVDDDEPPDARRYYFYPLLIGGNAATLCVGFFARKRLAEAHRRLLSKKDWRVMRVPREALLEWLECIHGAGVNHAVMDPPVGYRGLGEPIFSILVESL